MKIVIFTTIFNQYGFGLIQTLKKNGYNIEAIFIQNKKPKNNQPTIIQKIWRFFWNGYRLTKFNYSQFTQNVFYFENLNSEESENSLVKITPDLLILACAPIIKNNILDVPKKGTLNAHPGMLPNYKGLQSVERALADHKNPGVTVHWVDEGMDTGSIITQEEIKVMPCDSLKIIKEKGNDLSYKLMVNVLTKVANEITK